MTPFAKSGQIVKEVRSLRKKVELLSKEVDALKTIPSEDPDPVGSMLKMRGLKVHRKNPTDRLFFSPDLSPSRKTLFYQTMKKYSFRLVLRDMIKHESLFHVEDLTRYCSPEVVRDYCKNLHRMKIIQKNRRGGYRIAVSSLYSFGPTLEWFIAEMFRREYASPALYGVKLRETDAGGDYDVIASWNRRLVYVEVKSSPPRGIEQNEIAAFFSRIDELLPDVAILFNDTQLRMKDKLVVMFEEELKGKYGQRAKTYYPVTRLVEELFHVRDQIFIINSRKEIFENFSICLRHYLRNAIKPHCT